MIAPPVVGARWGERFDILEAKAGGPGRHTFRAFDRAMGAEVELWWILPGVHRDEAADAIVAHAAALRGLVHPQVRAVLDAGFDEGTTWVAYGPASPGVQPKETSPLPLPAVAAWARAVAAGLTAAHQVGWFHGRLVPADVVLVDGAVRVGGLALWMMAEAVSVAAWNAHAAYLAPEVVAGWSVGPPADAWGLAACVAALAAGTDRAIDERGWLEGRSPALAEAVKGALVPDPAARVSVAELIRRIDAAVAAAGPDAFAPMPSRAIAPPAKLAAPPPAPAARDRSAPMAMPPAPPARDRSAPMAMPPAPPARDQSAPRPLPLPPPADDGAFSPNQGTGAVAMSFRPGGQRPPTGQLAAARAQPPSSELPALQPRVVLRPLSEMSIVNVEPGEIGYVAPPRELAPPPAPRRRWVPVVGVLLGAAVAATTAIVIATQTGTDDDGGGGPAGGEAEPAGSAGAAADQEPPPPRLPLSPVEPARGCTDETLAMGDVCIDPYEAPGKGHVPATGLTARAAADACAARGLRLCTPAEWRQACAGTERVIAEAGACNLGKGAVIAAGGAFERCVSAIEARDMAGNVAEWVADGTALGASALDGGDGRCDGAPRTAASDATFADVGYRCCGDR